MKFDIIAAIVSFVLWIGFYTGELDWVLFWYGCKRKKEKEKICKIYGDEILRIATNCMGIDFSLSCIAILCKIMHASFFIYYLNILICLVFATMIMWTWILCSDKTD